MVFVLQNSQNAHTEDIQAKLDRIEKMLIESNRRETPRDP
jgi:low affinity Fe/Cu permease